LKDADGPFALTIYRHKMSAAAFIPPVKEFPGKSIPLEFDPGNYHFLSPANQETGSTA
jgi:hypothetical protein